MIDFKVGARDRKTLVAGGAVVLSLLLAGRAGPTWVRWRSDAAVSTRATLAEASAAAGTVRRARTVDAAIKRADVKRMEVSPAFVNGSGIAAAAATLASAVGEAATASGVRIGSLRASGDSAGPGSGGVGVVRVRGDGMGDLSGVTRFLASLEGGVPLIAVRELSVNQVQGSVSGGTADPLRIEFVLEGIAHFPAMERQ